MAALKTLFNLQVIFVESGLSLKNICYHAENERLNDDLGI